MNPITDRGPEPSFYDPPPPGALICDMCNGSGKFGCTNHCDDFDYPRELEICRQYHRCELCRGYGKLMPSAEDIKDAKAEWAMDEKRDRDI